MRAKSSEEESPGFSHGEDVKSQRRMPRASKLFQDLAEGDERLGGLAQRLIAALTQARQVQVAQLELLQARTREFSVRSAVLQPCLLDYGVLAQSAAGLNALLQAAAAMPEEDNDAWAAKAARVGGVSELMDQVLGQAQQLAKVAVAEHFSDVSRMADSLRQQLLSVRKNMLVVERRFEPGLLVPWKGEPWSGEPFPHGCTSSRQLPS